MRAAALRTAAARISWLRGALLVVFFALAARAAHLSVLDTRGIERFTGQLFATLRVPGPRGWIFDRDGRELAVPATAPSIYAMANELDESARAALARALGVDPARIETRLGKRRGFTFVARWVEADVAERVRALQDPAIGVLEEPSRSYPAGVLAASLVGFADIDGHGVRGVEQLEDEWLRGSERRVLVERDGSGKLLAHEPWRTSDLAGGDVALTIDTNLQAIAEAELQSAITRSGARGGTVLSLDPHTGEVLALAEAPGFDPNHFRTLAYSQTGSPAFQRAIEPGSALKVFLAAAALDHGSTDPSDLIDTTGGELALPGKTIRDARDHGSIGMRDMLRVSSNVAAVRIAQELGAKEHYKSLNRFGFGRASRSGFPSESAGLLRDWRAWQQLDHATIAFGQGLSVTVAQLAMATGALANGGLLLTPRIVAAHRRPGGTWQATAREVVDRSVSAEAASAVLDMMESVVSSEGTGRRAGLAALRVAGKTGTAQKFDTEKRRYSQEKFIAWFVGVAPADDPKLVVVVALDEPVRPLHTGGTIAAPLFASVSARQLAHFDVQTAPKPFPPPEKPLRESAPETTAQRIASAAQQPQRAEPRAVAAAPAEELPAVAAAPAVVATATASPPAKVADDEAVFVPNLIGSSRAEVRAITSQTALSLVASGGSGPAIAQEPVAGSILIGNARRISVRFRESGSRGGHSEHGNSARAASVAASGGRR